MGRRGGYQERECKINIAPVSLKKTGRIGFIPLSGFFSGLYMGKGDMLLDGE